MNGYTKCALAIGQDIWLYSYEVHVNPENVALSEEAGDVKATYCVNSVYVKSQKWAIPQSQKVD